MQTTSAQPKITVYGTPVSNYSARVRYLVRRKQLPEGLVDFLPPAELGGLKADDYLKLNPLGKMPAALVQKSDQGKQHCLYESSVICEYMAEVFDTNEPSFVPGTPEARAKARLIANILDIYVGPHHQFMYRKLEGGTDRDEGARNMLKGFDAIEQEMDEKGPYAVGTGLSIADCCLWGNWPFYDFMLPTFFGWTPTDGRPKLKAWLDHMRRESPAAKQVYTEVFEALQGWWDNGRWEKLGMIPLKSRPEISF